MPTTVKFQFRAENLDRKDFFGFGRSDPYLVVKEMTDETEKIKYRTRHLKQNCSPEWAPFYVKFEDENPKLKFEVLDRDMEPQDDLIGQFETSLNELLTNDTGEKRFDCINPKKKTNEKKAGVLFLKYCRAAVGVQLRFSVELPTTRLSYHKYYAKIIENEEVIFKSEKVRSNSADPVEWKAIDTGVEDINNTLKIEIFKFYKHCAPELIGDFELKKQTNTPHETKFSNKIFKLNQNGKCTGTVTLKICEITPNEATPVCLPAIPIPPPPPPPPGLELGPRDNQPNLPSHKLGHKDNQPNLHPAADRESSRSTFLKELANTRLKPVNYSEDSVLLSPAEVLEKELLRRRASIGTREVDDDEEWD